MARRRFGGFLLEFAVLLTAAAGSPGADNLSREGQLRARSTSIARTTKNATTTTATTTLTRSTATATTTTLSMTGTTSEVNSTTTHRHHHHHHEVTPEKIVLVVFIGVICVLTLSLVLCPALPTARRPAAAGGQARDQRLLDGLPDGSPALPRPPPRTSSGSRRPRTTQQQQQRGTTRTQPQRQR